VLRENAREEYSLRIKLLVWGRVVLSTFLVGTLIFFQRQFKIYTFHEVYLYYFLFSIYALTAVYWFLLVRLGSLLFHAYLQTSIDILLVTFLVYLTGGIDSGFSLLYHLTIISASILLYRRGGYLSASLTSILYGAMLDMQYYNVPGFVRSQNFSEEQVLYRVFISILSFYIVAFLSGYLSDRLRKTRQELREKSIDFEDLRVFQEHILRSVGSGIVTMDLHGNIASWNPAAESITGYGYEEIKDRWQEVFGECTKGLFGHTASLMERPFRFNGQILKKDGSIAILGLTASLLKDDLNAVRGIILIFQDITMILDMEERVRRQERLASIGSLAAGIAHEIRNPLAALSGSIQVLQGELALKGDNGHLMQIVVRETDRLNTIITEFLEYARPKVVHAKEIDLSSVIDENIMLLKNSRDFSNGIRISCEIAPDIRLHGDVQRLRQVFWNLLLNSCQALAAGGEIAVIATPFSRTEDETVWCEIVLSDTGPGIAREHLNKIFDPFFTTKQGGTGMGLAIAYRIIEDHGGQIAVESDPGKGTTVRIRLPMSHGPGYVLAVSDKRETSKPSGGTNWYEQDSRC
jgi:two-component system, NtrC family, sensor histidine kinase PilS